MANSKDLASKAKYNTSDKLAIALASGSVVVAIFLFISDKTAPTLIICILLMAAFAVYPVFHFTRHLAVRLFLLVFVLAVGAAPAWHEMRHDKPVSASAAPPPLQGQQPASSPPNTPTSSANSQSPAPKAATPKQKVGQSTTVQGHDNTAGNIDQSGSSNNTAIIGSSNTVNSGPIRAGWLKPAHDPTPDNPCTRRISAQGGLVVQLGTSIAGTITHFPQVILTVSGKPEITLNKNDKGEIALTTEIFDANEDVVVAIDENAYTISDSAFQVQTSPDRSSLAVVIKHHRERVLDVKYLNDKMIRIWGHFRFPGLELTANEDGILIGGNTSGPHFSDFCNFDNKFSAFAF